MSQISHILFKELQKLPFSHVYSLSSEGRERDRDAGSNHGNMIRNGGRNICDMKVAELLEVVK